MNFRVIKESELFYVANSEGNIPDPASDPFGYGLFAHDTRALSQWSLQLSPVPFQLLHTDVTRNFESVYRCTNLEFRTTDGHVVPPHTVHLTRRQLVDGHCVFEECTVDNHSDVPIELSVTYTAAADFRDMFAVRGFQGPDDADHTSVRCDDNVLLFERIARDGLRYSTSIQMTVTPARAETSADSEETRPKAAGLADLCTQAQPVRIAPASTPAGTWTLSATVVIPAGGSCRWCVKIEHTQSTDPGTTKNTAQTAASLHANVSEVMHAARTGIAQAYHQWLAHTPRVDGPPALVRWYERGLLDVRMLLSDIGHGPFPVAGVPWYAVPFGRDSLITAWQTLMADTRLAAGTLRTMAAYQGTSLNPARDEEPGKIMHELRSGEWARTGIVPFHPYYGTIDATPLFLILAAEYIDWTGDLNLIRELLPCVQRAFAWIEQYGDRDGDGFVEYLRAAEGGIVNQGWKDSGDAIVHPDGTLAEGAIALCEVQGYVYLAYRKWEKIYKYLGEPELAEQCAKRAADLRSRFLERFWLPESKVIALALDGSKRPVETATSNMGHVLWSGILPEEVAHQVIDRLLADDMFSGFGVRTLSASAPAYNPLSYHRGSVWPHDNSIILAGMKRYGRTDGVTRIAAGLLRAAEGFELARLPELFAGYSTDETDQPVPYPVSCSPQAWAAGTPISVLQTLLGLEPDALDGTVRIHPYLPDGIDALRIASIRIGDGSLSLQVKRETNGLTSVAVEQNTTGLAVVLHSM